MPTTLKRSAVKHSAVKRSSAQRVTPSKVGTGGQHFTLEQELKPFGEWTSAPIWVPPKDESKALAQTMIDKHGPTVSRERRWKTVERKHRSDFTQVRQINLYEASIRLPKGNFFVTLTERKDFDNIEDTIPACVQTRLDEFLEKYGARRGVKVYYLKPLCVEVGDDLLLTSEEDLMEAIKKVQEETFAAYRKLYVSGLPRRIAAAVVNASLSIPRSIANAYMDRRQKALDAYHAKLEFRRRRTAHEAAKTHRKCRTTGCTYEEMLDLTNPLETEDVIKQYAIENELSRKERERLLRMAAGTIPWFVALSMAAVFATTAIATITAPPVMVCDPAFVAEMPSAPGVLLKIGHFDEIAGVTHVEI